MSDDTNLSIAPEPNSNCKSWETEPPVEVFDENNQPETPQTEGEVEDGRLNPEPLQPTSNKDTEDNAVVSKTTVSARRLAANRQNAKCSTGPKTPEGKATSSRNSYKHGIFSASLVRQGELENHDSSVFETIVDAIAGYYQPDGFMEQLLVEKITTETMRFRRLLWFEQVELGRNHPFFNDAVDRVLRYQATINRQLFQAMEQLERLQARRKEQSSKNDDKQSASCGSGAKEQM